MLRRGPPGFLPRTKCLGAVAAGPGLGRARDQQETSEPRGGRFYWNVTGFPFPLGPFLERNTIRVQVQRGSIWTFEQQQALGFSSVTTNVRMTVIKLKTGGLWVHAPIAPTKECLRLLGELDAPVEHIVLPTFAYEHKIFMGPFSRKFPRAKLWTAPSQWSWPLNLPLPFFGIFKSTPLTNQGQSPPWASEIEYKVFQSPEVGIGPYVEVAFLHQATKTLLVTDAVILVPKEAPQVVPKEALLQAAENGLAVQLLSGGKEVPKEPVLDTPEARRRGWQRMVLQILYFGPSNLLDPRESFSRVADRLIVSPVVKTLVFCKVPTQAREWVDSIVNDWTFRRIIPAHFSAPISAGPSDFKAAFAFLYDPPPQDSTILGPVLRILSPSYSRAVAAFPTDDMRTLTSLDKFLVSVGAVRKTTQGQE